MDYAIDVYKQLHSDEEDPPEPQGNVKVALTLLTLPLPSSPILSHPHTHRDDRAEEGGGREAP